MATGGTNLSKEFFELLKAIGESKSKQEEDRIIQREVTVLKKKMEAKGSGGLGQGPPGGQNTLLNSKKRSKEFLVRLLYVEMLGHDASFAYIKAVELTASASLYHKRTGYLVCSACLPPEHEFRFMLVNQMQRDLQSSHVLEICGGILAAGSIITSDMVPAVSGEVMKLLDHASETVRKKAIMCLAKFHQIAPETVTKPELMDKLRKVLCDRDPAVMGASLNVIEQMAVPDPQSFKDLIPSLVSILKQIGDHRLPTDFDYHRIPAPWMQMKLIRILGILGSNDASASSGMYEILADTMKKADVGINAGYAVVFEVIKTIVSIYPNATLLDAAGDAISRFIQSKAHNLKYLGVTGLALIVETHPQYAAAHQLAVMDCLEDKDETLQRKTLDLLWRMTNPVNVEFITEKLLEFLRGTTDQFLKKVLTTRICSVSERYAPNNAWYIRTITELFEISGDMVSPEVAQNLMGLIAEGTGESEEADMLLRQNAIEIYVNLLQTKPPSKIPKILLETMAWCLGEYGYLSAVESLEQVLERLCTIARTHKAKLHPTTLKFLLSAVMKLVAQAGTCPPHAAALIDDFTHSQDADLQQRCLEFQTMLTTAPHMLGSVMPVDASAEDVQVDANLSFLDGFVNEALSTGANPYNKPEDDDDDDDDAYGASSTSASASAFKMTPYEKPTTPARGFSNLMRGVGSDGPSGIGAGVSLPPGAGYGSSGAAMTSPAASAGAPQQLRLNTNNVASVWGKGGLSQPAATPAPAPAPAAASGYGGFVSDTASSAAPAPSNPYGNYGSSFGAAPAPPPAPVKTEAQLEKERQAAALFGGVIPGQAPPPPTMKSAPVAPPPPVPTAPVPAPAPAVPAPAAEIDLLDFGSMETTPAPAAAAPAIDIFAPQPVPAPAPVVETVTEDDDEVVAAPTAPPPGAPTDDPFAASGLLGDLTDKPLTSMPMQSTNKFEFGGMQMGALQLTTPQFGEKWGTSPATSTASIVDSSKVVTLDQFMELCQEMGAAKVEAIAATNEGICAGIVGGDKLALIHGKVTPVSGSASNVDVTVKSSDSTMAGVLAMFMQSMLK